MHKSSTFPLVPAAPDPAQASPRRSSPAAPSGDAEPQALAEGFDRWLHAQIGKATATLSPAALLLAAVDWAAHLALSPGKQWELLHKATRKQVRLAQYLAHTAQGNAAPCIEPLPQDRRFADPGWHHWPFNLYSQSFLLAQQWWHNATTGVRGVSRHHEEVVTFAARQWLDMLSPSNFVPTNPQVLQRTGATLGANLVAGALHGWDDWHRLLAGLPPDGTAAFRVGDNLAVTPGRVVMRNGLAELIQYAPTTPQVHPEPILILPAWIMKYYILDLQPQDSLIKSLVDRGHTVFCVSWKNPGPQERNCGIEDYLQLGLMASLEAVNTIVPDRPVHAVGYCLGGTLLAIGAAAMARDEDHRLATLTLLAAQTDFSEPGEIGLFIDESEVSFLEDTMFDRGVLTREQMAGAFQLLRSNDLIWSRAVHDYLMGERSPVSGLMAWNADATRMPYRMHSQYLRGLFLRNDLAAGRFRVGGRPVALSDLDLPIFCLGTQTDHVAPWRSVYKLHLLADTDVTFVLTEGGHNAGVISPPGLTRHNHRLHTRRRDDKYLEPDAYLARATSHPGSWWPQWQRWLALNSGPQGVAPPSLGEPLCDAPGRYVLER